MKTKQIVLCMGICVVSWFLMTRCLPVLNPVWFVVGWAALFTAFVGPLSKDKGFVAAFFTGLALRIALGVALYFVSLYRIPIFESLQKTVPGFWVFAMDSAAAHIYAVDILQTWKTGIEYPAFTHGAIEFYFTLAGVYWLFGPNPLYGILFNVAISALTLPLAYRLVGHWSEEQTPARWATWILALWPSMILWSTQLLKDSICLLCVVAFFLIFHKVRLAFSQKQWLHFLKHLLLMVLTVFFLTKYRSYIGIGLSLSVVFLCGVLFLKALWQKQKSQLAFLGIFSLVVLSTAAFAYQFPYPQRWVQIQREFIELKRENPELTKKDFFRSYVDKLNEEVQDEAEQGIQTYKATIAKILSYPNAALNNLQHQASLTTFMRVRQGMAREGGRSNVYEEAQIYTFGELMVFLPRAMAVAWFSPFPNQWMDKEASTGVFRVFSGLETLVFYGFFLFFLWGMYILYRRYPLDTLLVTSFCLMFSFLLGIAIPNVGTLYRLRAPIVLMVLLVATLIFAKGKGLLGATASSEQKLGDSEDT